MRALCNCCVSVFAYVFAYALAIRCPVLTQRMVGPECAAYWRFASTESACGGTNVAHRGTDEEYAAYAHAIQSDTDLADGAISLRARYGKPGSDVAYGGGAVGRRPSASGCHTEGGTSPHASQRCP
eukprot:467885-Rhodomonas_salina.2